MIMMMMMMMASNLLISTTLLSITQEECVKQSQLVNVFLFRRKEEDAKLMNKLGMKFKELEISQSSCSSQACAA